MEVEESIFILTDEQRVVVESLTHYTPYFYMLRPMYTDHPIVQLTMLDIATVYYFPETPYYNPQLSMIYILRHSIVQRVVMDEAFSRLKKRAIESKTKALFAAALTLNLFIDVYAPIFEGLDEEKRRFYMKFSKNPRMLFDVGLEKFNDYPQRYVTLETQILQQLREALQTDSESFYHDLQRIVRLFDQYMLDERKIYLTNL